MSNQIQNAAVLPQSVAVQGPKNRNVKSRPVIHHKKFIVPFCPNWQSNPLSHQFFQPFFFLSPTQTHTHTHTSYTYPLTKFFIVIFIFFLLLVLFVFLFLHHSPPAPSPLPPPLNTVRQGSIIKGNKG